MDSSAFSFKGNGYGQVPGRQASGFWVGGTMNVPRDTMIGAADGASSV